VAKYILVHNAAKAVIRLLKSALPANRRLFEIGRVAGFESPLGRRNEFVLMLLGKIGLDKMHCLFVCFLMQNLGINRKIF
jgi:hypothetical protein